MPRDGGDKESWVEKKRMGQDAEGWRGQRELGRNVWDRRERMAGTKRAGSKRLGQEGKDGGDKESWVETYGTGCRGMAGTKRAG